MRILVTGADGFLGSNLRVRLRELGFSDVVSIVRTSTREELLNATSSADFVFHLAGVNRPKSEADFVAGNAGFTENLCAALAASSRRASVVFASSTQATIDNAYGRSKRAAEEYLMEHARATGSRVHLFRLTNVFGKWCRPNYNSVVATFCHQIANGLAPTINNSAAPLRLAYVDDVVAAFNALLPPADVGTGYMEAGPVYDTTVGEVARALQEFSASRSSQLIPRVGSGLLRALYATYVSYLPPEAFAYDVPRHGDARGVFVEMLKTPDCGQLSYFTAHPGVTRGEHYHHTKTEKFLVLWGTAHFGFRHIATGQTHELVTRGGEARIVETIPGWTHNITNVGDDVLIVMLWANEIFDRERPDTVPMKVTP